MDDESSYEGETNPKRLRNTCDVYTALGFYTDCQNLLNDYLALETSRYEDFVKVWKAKRFALIFCGRDSFAELLEFTEEAMLIAKSFILPPHSQIKRIGGLYLMFGMYTQQPTKGLVKFRITPREWSIILKFVDNLKTHGFIDANYIFHKLCLDGAFLTVAYEREHGLDRNMRKYLMPWPARDKEFETCATFSMESLLSRVCHGSLMEGVNSCLEKYNDIKQKLCEAPSSSGPSFVPVPGTSTKIETILIDGGEEVENNGTDDTRRLIKLKAFETQSSSVPARYRSCVEDTSAEAEPPERSDTENEDDPDYVAGSDISKPAGHKCFPPKRKVGRPAKYPKNRIPPPGRKIAQRELSR